MAVRTLVDIERDIADAYTSMLEYRVIGDESAARHCERWMNVKLDELSLRLSLVAV